MNIFSNIGHTLINLKAFTSLITIQNISSERINGKKVVKVISEKNINAIISSIDKTLIDSNKFEATDLQFFYSVKDYKEINSIDYRIKINDEIYSIVSIFKLAVLNNSPAIYKVIIRK